MSVTPIWITDFMNAVYDGYGALALSSFNEEKALRDATEKIRSLESRARAYQEVVEAVLTSGIEFGACVTHALGKLREAKEGKV